MEQNHKILVFKVIPPSPKAELLPVTPGGFSFALVDIPSNVVIAAFADKDLAESVYRLLTTNFCNGYVRENYKIMEIIE